MAQDTQQFGAKEPQSRKVNELSSSPSVEIRLFQITAMLNKLVIGGVQNAVVCSICYLKGQAIGVFPIHQARM